MKKWKKCPLLIVTAISMLLVSGVALAGTKGAYKEYNKDWPKVPAVAGMMQASKEGILPWDKAEPEEDLESVYADKEEPVTEEATEAVADTEAEADKTYTFTDVTQDYFDDAVFIGDSRTVGLRDYGIMQLIMPVSDLRFMICLIRRLSRKTARRLPLKKH